MESQGFGITDIVLDPMNPDSNLVNMLTKHGRVTLEKIQNFEAVCIATKSRAAQDTHYMCRCVMNSLSKEAQKVKGSWKSEHTMVGRVPVNALLKVLVRESGLDTKFTTAHIRTCLS